MNFEEEYSQLEFILTLLNSGEKNSKGNWVVEIPQASVHLVHSKNIEHPKFKCFARMVPEFKLIVAGQKKEIIFYADEFGSLDNSKKIGVELRINRFNGIEQIGKVKIGDDRCELTNYEKKPYILIPAAELGRRVDARIYLI